MFPLNDLRAGSCYLASVVNAGLLDWPHRNGIGEVAQIQGFMYGDQAGSRTSPLRENFRDFTGQAYYPIQEKYRVTAKLKPTPEAEPFELTTSSGKKKILLLYRK